MSEWLISLEGTAAGSAVATWLVLAAALLHAVLGSLQKGRHNPWHSRAMIDVFYGLTAGFFAIFVVPFPEPFMWPIFAGAWVIHTIYKALQASALERGDFTLVYPVMRGTGPLVTVLAAGLVFGEVYSGLQWLGVGILLTGIFGLGAYNIWKTGAERRMLANAIFLAVACGVSVAAYTTYDAYAIRATADPFTFLAWFFMIDGFAMPAIVLIKSGGVRNIPDLAGLARRGIIGAWVALLSFGLFMLATRIDKVGEAAVLRETSIVFAALIGWLFLKERVGPKRTALMVMISAGAILVEIGR